MDNDEIMKSISRGYFGYEETDKSQTFIKDGVTFIQDQLYESSIPTRCTIFATSEKKYNVVIIDACFNKDDDNVICPVADFRVDYAADLLSQLVDHGGTIIVNLLSKENPVKDEDDVSVVFFVLLFLDSEPLQVAL